MKFFDSIRNRVIIASVVLLVVAVVTAIVSFSTDTLPDYEIVETEVSKAYDKLNAENNDNTIFEKYYLTENYIKRIKRNTSIEDFKKVINSPILSIEHFEYKNHDYIIFDSGDGHWAGGGVVHDPDCDKCKENSCYEKNL